MARYQNRIPLQNVDMNFVANEIAKYLTAEGFSQVNYKGQTVWKKGVGMLTAPQYVTLNVTNTEVLLEGFIRFALFPGVYIGEMGTRGFFAAAPKMMLKKRITAVEQYLYSILQQQAEQAR